MKICVFASLAEIEMINENVISWAINEENLEIYSIFLPFELHLIAHTAVINNGKIVYFCKSFEASIFKRQRVSERE